jgi:uncharacterized protein (DUF2267 family)
MGTRAGTRRGTECAVASSGQPAAADAVQHARAVIAVLQEAVSPGEIEDVRSQLPRDFDRLFEAGSEGAMPRQ